MSTAKYSVRRVTRSECEPFVIGIHYASRWPSISHAFGLFEHNELVGICTFGSPASAPLRTGIAGKENSSRVIELNRLCLLNNKKNEASMLIAKCLRDLAKGTIVVSFADTAQGHFGYVYQACNFRYFGLSAKRTDWKVKGMEHRHGQTIADEFRGSPNRAQAMRDKYGDSFYLAPRSRKHRYIYITGSRPDYSIINYEQFDYPKSKTNSYESGNQGE